MAEDSFGQYIRQRIELLEERGAQPCEERYRDMLASELQRLRGLEAQFQQPATATDLDHVPEIRVASPRALQKAFQTAQDQEAPAGAVQASLRDISQPTEKPPPQAKGSEQVRPAWGCAEVREGGNGP